MKKTRKYLKTVSVGDRVWLLPNYRILATGVKVNLNKALKLPVDKELIVSEIRIERNVPFLIVEGSVCKLNIQRFTKDPP